ncbi:MAG: protein kinase [Planctomycetota bacterium]|nr:MAG: protein kinase [Planctomycetota bacterium]
MTAKVTSQKQQTCERVKKGDYCAVVDRCFCDPAQFCEFVKNIDGLMCNGQIIKSLKGSRSTYVARLWWNDKDILVKRYNYKGFVHSFRHTLKKSRARHSWIYSHRLRTLSVPTPKPLGYVEMYWGPFLKKSYFISEYLDAQSLYDYLQDSPTSKEQSLCIASKVGHLLQQMQKHKIFHGDLKLQNFLLKDEAVIVDLDRMRAHKWNWMYRFWRRKDLARLRRYVQKYPAFATIIRRWIV